jgi:HPt (histidine-containing phosphotransfer) domain-containing protein
MRPIRPACAHARIFTEEDRDDHDLRPCRACCWSRTTSSARFSSRRWKRYRRHDHATGIADAQCLADANRHALWLIDVHLPTAAASKLLPACARAARTHRHWRIPQPTATHSASDACSMPASRRAGQADHATPVAGGGTRTDPAVTSPPAGDWDDDAALKALNGQSAHVQALRELFLSELPGVRERVVLGAQAGNVDALRAELHRLQASCGFVGADRMGNAVTALRSQPIPRRPDQPAGRHRRHAETGYRRAKMKQTTRPRRSAFRPLFLLHQFHA